MFFFCVCLCRGLLAIYRNSTPSIRRGDTKLDPSSFERAHVPMFRKFHSINKNSVVFLVDDFRAQKQRERVPSCLLSRESEVQNMEEWTLWTAS